MTDLVTTLDALAEKAASMSDTTNLPLFHWLDFANEAHKSWPRLRAELLAAREVCEAVDVGGYLKHDGPLPDKWFAWRAARGEGK